MTAPPESESVLRTQKTQKKELIVILVSRLIGFVIPIFLKPATLFGQIPGQEPNGIATSGGGDGAAPSCREFSASVHVTAEVQEWRGCVFKSRNWQAGSTIGGV